MRRLWNNSVRMLHAFLPHLIREDTDFAVSWLTETEARLFRLMDVRDRNHSIFVARELLAVHPAASRELVAAALLHDVAKSRLPFNPWYRVAVRLLRPQGRPQEPLQSGFQGALQLGEHHEVMGSAMLLEAGADEAVARLIAGLAGDRTADLELQLLRQADRRT